MWKQWLNFIFGLWIILSGYIGFTGSGIATNMTITGILVAGLALWGALQHNTMTRGDRRNEERMHRHA